MKNFFEWEYNQASFLQKQQKFLPNTDHTTSHAYQRLIQYSFNPNDSKISLNDKEQRMLHVEDEDQYLNNHDNDAEDLQFLEDDDQIHPKLYDSAPNKQENLNCNEKDAADCSIPKFEDEKGQDQIQTEKNAQIQVQKSADYKLSKKWKQKMNNVLEQKKINQFSAKHNRNMAKFFVRLFSKYMKMCPEGEKFSTQVRERLQQILEKNCVSLEDLENLLGCETSGPSRQFLCKILRTKLKQEVIKSQDVQNKAAYLLCSKVFALRCRSRHLIGRLQSR